MKKYFNFILAHGNVFSPITNGGRIEYFATLDGATLFAKLDSVQKMVATQAGKDYKGNPWPIVTLELLESDVVKLFGNDEELLKKIVHTTEVPIWNKL